MSDLRNWMVIFHHDRGGTSWWGTEIASGETPRDAAAKMETKIDDHAPIGGALRVRVFGPIPSDLAGEFSLSRCVVASPIFELD